MLRNQSKTLYQRARKKIPGGVNSPGRAWQAVGGTPAFIARGKRAYLFDTEGRKYIDFVASWGPLILGHAHPKIVQQIKKTAARGTTFGAPTEGEVELAELVCRLVPSIEAVRLVSSGTEATMSAVRLARACTGRTKIIKFDGCYHGHADGLLVKAGSGIAALGLPDSPGVPPGFARETLVARFNDPASLEGLFDRHGKNIAAVIVEPVCGNMGVIPPAPGFLAAVRKMEEGYRAVLRQYGIHGTVNRVGSMMTIFFGVDRVQSAADARRGDCAQFARYFHGMLRRGVYWPPSQFEAAFVSLSHLEKDIAKTLQAFSAWAREERRR